MAFPISFRGRYAIPSGADVSAAGLAAFLEEQGVHIEEVGDRFVRFRGALKLIGDTGLGMVGSGIVEIDLTSGSPGSLHYLASFQTWFGISTGLVATMAIAPLMISGETSAYGPPFLTFLVLLWCWICGMNYFRASRALRSIIREALGGRALRI